MIEQHYIAYLTAYGYRWYYTGKKTEFTPEYSINPYNAKEMTSTEILLLQAAGKLKNNTISPAW